MPSLYKCLMAYLVNFDPTWGAFRARFVVGNSVSLRSAHIWICHQEIVLADLAPVKVGC